MPDTEPSDLNHVTNRWIGVRGDEVLCEAETPDGVLVKLSEMGVDTAKPGIGIRFLSLTPPAVSTSLDFSGGEDAEEQPKS